MARTQTEDPLKNFRYAVSIDGFGRFGFSEVSGFERETEKIEYREGGDLSTPRKSPGLSKYSDITFRRGQLISGNTAGGAGGENDIHNWSEQIMSLTSQGAAIEIRREPVVTQFAADYSVAHQWTVKEAWITKYKPFSDLKGLGNEDSIEEMVLACEGWEQTL